MLTFCMYCGCFINTDLGIDPPPAGHEKHAGTRDDPRPPGDWDNVCDDCGRVRPRSSIARYEWESGGD